jgi:membrane associated rhomboid family serine protease
MFLPYDIEEEYEYERKPVLLVIICAVTALIHAWLYLFLTENQRENIFYEFGAVPSDFKIWTPLTCTLLHGGFMHILTNLYFLWIYGKTIEKHLGHLRFALIYVVGAYVSIIFHLLTVPKFSSDIPAIGASGAVSAILGAFFVLFPKVKMRVLVFSIIFSRPLPSQAPAYFVLGLWFIVQIAYGLQLPGDFAEVAFWAHIGGFAAGALCGTVFLKQFKEMERREIEAGCRESRIAQAVANFANADTQNAKKFLIQFHSTKIDEFEPENWRLADAMLAFFIDDDAEESAKLIKSEVERLGKSAGDGQFLQLYYLAARSAPELYGTLFHLSGGICASKMKNRTIANFAFLQSGKKILADKIEFENFAERYIAAYKSGCSMPG